MNFVYTLGVSPDFTECVTRHELKGQTTGVSKGLFRVLLGFEIMNCSFRSEESPCSQVLELAEESTSNKV